MLNRMHKVAEINLYIPIVIINVNKLTLSVKRIRVEFLKKTPLLLIRYI